MVTQKEIISIDLNEKRDIPDFLLIDLFGEGLSVRSSALPLGPETNMIQPHLKGFAGSQDPEKGNPAVSPARRLDLGPRRTYHLS